MSYETRLQEVTTRVAAYLYHFIGEGDYNFNATGYDAAATDRVLSFQMREYALGADNLEEVSIACSKYVAARRPVRMLLLEIDSKRALEETAREIIFHTGDFTGVK